MEFDIRLMSLSHSLEKHPVLEEDIKYKIKYLNVLEYFVNKYSKKDEFAIETLKNYKKAFLGKDIEQYSYSEQELKRVSNGVIGVRFKGFKLFTYRYVLLCDCLYINAMMDSNKANKILSDIKDIYRKRYHERIDLLFDVLYKEKKSIKGLDKIKYQVKCWKDNKEHLNKKQLTVLTTANMSAGKSTLINAIIGKSINRTMNDSCTSKVHYIYDKAFEDGFNYELDGVLNLDADEKVLLNDDSDKNNDIIFVSTYFRLLTQKQSRLCIIDTPGVNSALNSDHTKITKETVLNKQYDKVLYLINAENSGTEDDLRYLQFICENIDENKIIFVLNKLDCFRNSEDSIEDSIANLKADLLKLGLKNPIICPVSSYAGRLAKKKMFGSKLNEDEQDDYIILQRKFKDESYNLSRFYSENILKKINENYSDNEKSPIIDLLINCGILCLEQIITEGVEY
ncbi:dynamin family protein [uncultured Clostridium sp.]|uniref:dynamin family protein n=1 Tax=uncultured Clostridium sp. TaxID=59620 RepID=UPI002584E351|nr:dynamin family protein [uncultured Clostridium sp.]